MPKTRKVWISETNRPVMGLDEFTNDDLFLIETGIRISDRFYLATGDVS